MSASKDQIILEIDKFRLEATQKVKKGCNLAENNQFFYAIGEFQEALAFYKKIPISTQNDLQQLLTCYNYLTSCCTENDHQEESIKLFHELIFCLKDTDLLKIATVQQLDTFIAECYENLYNLYLEQEEEFEALACAIGAASIYEKFSNISPIYLLRTYYAIIVEYRFFEQYEDVIYYCEKALRIYYAITNPSDKIKEIANEIIDKIGDIISNDEVPHDLQIKLFQLGLSFPKLCEGFYQRGRFNCVILFCHSNINFLSSMPLEHHRTLYIAKFHLLAGMALNKSKQYLLTILEVYKAINTINYLNSDLINADKHALLLLENANNQLFKTYSAVAANYVLYNNIPLANIYKFCAFWFTRPPNYSTFSSQYPNTEQGFILKLQCINDSLKKAVMDCDRNCSEAASVLNQLLTFILDTNYTKLFFLNTFSNILSSPTNIDNIRQLLTVTRKISADIIHRSVHTMTQAQQNHPVFSAPTMPSTPLTVSNDDIRTTHNVVIVSQSHSQKCI